MSVRTLVDLCNIPEILRECTLEVVPNNVTYKVTIQKYIDRLPEIIKTRQGLYLFGDYGAGKSSLAAVILMAAARQHSIPGFWTHAKKLAGYVIERTEWLEGITHVERCQSIPLLVIDEIQLRQNTGFQESVVEDLIRDRVSAGKPTIITSNLTPEMVKTYYPALYSVLTECVCPLHVYGKDFRGVNKGIVFPGLLGD